jgi:hypothetical protein
MIHNTLLNGSISNEDNNFGHTLSVIRDGRLVNDESDGVEKKAVWFFFFTDFCLWIRLEGLGKLKQKTLALSAFCVSSRSWTDYLRNTNQNFYHCNGIVRSQKIWTQVGQGEYTYLHEAVQKQAPIVKRVRKIAESDY